jgi:phospholipid-translocating ATPase
MRADDTFIGLGETPSKRSKIEKETNFNVLANFVILIGLCAACGIADGVFESRTNTSADLYEPGADETKFHWLDGVVTFCSALILFQNIVPISLVITVELVKTIQAYFIFQDIQMYYEPVSLI